MITQERYNGPVLPRDLPGGGLTYSFAFRVADTQGVRNSTTNWIYTELPDTAVINRQRSASLDEFSQQMSITVLEDALPAGFAILQYMVLEVDLVDSMGNQWPYHTGPIDSISETYQLVGNAVQRTLDITSFGVIQNAKDAFTTNNAWQAITASLTGALTLYSTVRHTSYTGTGGLPTRLIGAAFNTVDARDTSVAGYHGFVVSTNTNWSAPKVLGVDYNITDAAGVVLNEQTSKNTPIYIKWLTAEPAATIYIKFWQLEYAALANINGSTFPDVIRLPDYNIPFQFGTKPSLKRELWDDYATTVASATSTTLTPTDNGGYRELGTNNPSSGWTEHVEWTRADTGASEVRTVSSIAAATGVVTVTVAFSSTPQVGDFMRIVTTRPQPAFARYNSSGSASSIPTEKKSSGGADYPRGSWEYKPDQGVWTPTALFHFASIAVTASLALLYVTNLRYPTQTTSAAIGGDNRIESGIDLALSDYVPGYIMSGVSAYTTPANGYFGKHNAMGVWVQNLISTNESPIQFIQRLADNGFPPNGKLFDRNDGSVVVAAIKQSTTADYSLNNIISVKKNYVAEPPTGVSVLSKYPETMRLNNGQFFNAVNSGWTSGTQYLFDGSDSPDPTNSGTDFAFATVTAGSSATVTINVPDFCPVVFDPINKIVIKGLSGVVEAQIDIRLKSTNASVATQSVWAGQRKVVSQSESPEITSVMISEMFDLLKSYNRFNRNNYYASFTFTFRDTDLINASTMVPRITEIEVWGDYNAAWIALLTDDLSDTSDDGYGSPTGWTTTSSITNVGPSFWKRMLGKNLSFKYMDPSTYKRLTPKYDTDWFDCRYRMVTINQTRISTVDCKNIAERYLNEAVIKSNIYSVTAILDPRVDLGDTVAVTLPDGSVLELMVYSYSDSGGPQDLTCTYELVDYSGLS